MVTIKGGYLNTTSTLTDNINTTVIFSATGQTNVQEMKSATITVTPPNGIGSEGDVVYIYLAKQSTPTTGQADELVVMGAAITFTI